MGRIDGQLKKGVLESLVLKLLTIRDMYGYEMIQELDRLSQGGFSLKEGTLYPILYRLEDSKFIASYWQEGQGKRVPRKYYRLTGSGEAELNRAAQEWRRFSAIVNIFLGEEGQ